MTSQYIRKAELKAKFQHLDHDEQVFEMQAHQITQARRAKVAEADPFAHSNGKMPWINERWAEHDAACAVLDDMGVEPVNPWSAEANEISTEAWRRQQEKEQAA